MELLASKSRRIGRERILPHFRNDLASDSGPLRRIRDDWPRNRGPLQENLDLGVFGNIARGCGNEHAILKDGSYDGIHHLTSLFGVFNPPK